MFGYDDYAEIRHHELWHSSFENDLVISFELRSAINTLTPIQREIIIAHFFHGMTIHEIAKRREVKAQTVSDSIKGAKKKNKKVFGNYLINAPPLSIQVRGLFRIRIDQPLK